jgi:hypothetical protein
MIPTTSPLQRQIAQKAAVALLLATLSWMCLLLFDASASNKSLGLYQVTAGPLVLHEISQMSGINGREVSLSFEPGLLWYFLGWILLGCSVGWLSYKRSTQKRPLKMQRKRS